MRRFDLYRVLVWSMVMACAAGVHAAACPTDTNGDGVVDVDDLINVVLDWDTDGAANGGDVDGSGLVDVDDLLTVLLEWGTCLEDGVFPVSWINGTNCGLEPTIQMHAYNDDFYIFRQSLCTNFEGPFVYLLFGQDKVLLQDTGAGGIQLAARVYGVIDNWLAAHGKDSIELIVTHSHGHGDHTAGDSQFVGQPNTTVVGTSQTAVATFFGITNWPKQIVEYDLGGRVIDIVPIPGHQSAHIALYDRRTGNVFTGDTLYPGRLYISNFSQYVSSIDRLVSFLDSRPVCWVLGTHIEMTNTPGVDFPFASTSHPDEHPLPLNRGHVIELQQGVHGMKGSPQIEPHDDFIIFPL